MTSKARRTEIQIETHEIKIIRFRGKEVSSFCERCRENVSAFTHKQAAELLQISLPNFCRLIEAGTFHLVRTTRGPPLVCSNSLDEGKKQ